MNVMRVQVVGMEKIEGVSKKTGQPYMIRRAHVVLQMDGATLVAKVAVPRQMADLSPGVYDITVKPYIDREGQLQFAVVSYVPVSEAAARRAA